MILADAVEVLNGKLYLMGGGWDAIFVPALQSPVTLSIACGVNVTYNETDDEHSLSVAVRDLDGIAVGQPITLSFRTGRSPMLARGASTHVPIAIKAAYPFSRYDEYVIAAAVDDRHESRLSFFVRTPPGSPVLMHPARQAP